MSDIRQCVSDAVCSHSTLEDVPIYREIPSAAWSSCIDDVFAAGQHSEGCYSMNPGRAIAQAVSRRLPIAAAWVQTRVWSCRIL
jgi:hypothetical protein